MNTNSIKATKNNTASWDVVKQNRENVKNSLVKKTFLQYLSMDFMKIRNFVGQNKIIKFRFFFFMFLNPALPQLFAGCIQRPETLSLYKFLFGMRDNGWRVFSKLTYNKLVFLCEFLQSLIDLDVKVFYQHPDDILRALRSIEKTFYILFSDKTLISSLERELELYGKIMKQTDFPVDSIIHDIQTLFAANIHQCTLYSLFLSLNSISSRRYCTIKQLIRDDTGPFFYDSDFDMAGHTRQQLTSYTAEVIDAIKKNMIMHEDILIFEDFIPLRGRVNNKDLKDFYNSEERHSSDSRYTDDRYKNDRYKKDQNNTLFFVVYFSQKFIAEFRRILTAEISLSGNKSGRIFEETLFSNYFGRIEFFTDKLDTIMNKVPILKSEEYFEVLATDKDIGAGTPAAHIIIELLNVYFQIAKILVSVIKYATHSMNSEHVPVVRLIAFKDMQFFIPFDDVTQFSSPFLMNKTVRAALRVVAKILLLFCFKLKEQELLHLINKDKNILSILNQYINELNRVLSGTEFEKVKQLHHFSKVEAELDAYP